MGPEIIAAYNELDAVRQLFQEYDDWLYELAGMAPRDGAEAELPGSYAHPYGRLYIARRDGHWAGCAALRRFDGSRGELQRLYVRPEFRGLKLGRALADLMVSEAQKIGYKALLLDTLPALEAANALYKSLGFQEIKPYYFNPRPDMRYMEIRLKPATSNKHWI
ncbi:MAG: GNAT family N-acetyltransferase [Syntrophomonadaceae bacterium]|nr:GNAT family N-acetyltransferase [Syntrophomonadaceae bacterium]